MLKPKPGDLVVTSWYEPKQTREFKSIVGHATPSRSWEGGVVVIDPPMLVIAVERHPRNDSTSVLVMSCATCKIAYVDKNFIKSTRNVKDK